MALINCPECGKKISDKATACPSCGYPIKEHPEEKSQTNLPTPKKCEYPSKTGAEPQWAKMRRRFSIVNLAIGFFLLAAVLRSKGGIYGNQRIMISSFLSIAVGIVAFEGFRNARLTIVSIVLYSIGILYNLLAATVAPGHLILATIHIIFLILTSVSLSKGNTFEKNNPNSMNSALRWILIAYFAIYAIGALYGKYI